MEAESAILPATQSGFAQFAIALRRRRELARLDLLFWNAVRPITAFDSAHPMGFFNGENDSKLAIAYWTIGLITRQIAEAEDPLKQQDAMLMVAELNPSNLRMILAAC